VQKQGIHAQHAFIPWVNAAFYRCNQIASGTCSPRIFHLSKRFTVTFGTSGNGTWKHIYDGLYLAVHDRDWEESPALAIIDAQFVRTGQNAHDNVGFDVRKNIKRRTSGVLFSTTV
jgi:hypothetical protein